MGEVKKPLDPMSSLINLSFFIMRKEAKQIRKSLHKGIVEMAIFWGRRSGVFKREISGLIERNLPLIKLPKRIIDNSLQILLKEGNVIQTRTKGYVLSASRLHELERTSETRSRATQKLNSIILEEIRQRLNRDLSKDERERIVRDFYLFLSLIIRSKSKLGAHILTAKEVIPSEILDL